MRERVRVIFLPSGRSWEGAAGISLFHAVRASGMPMGAACAGEGICGQCGLEVVEGAEALSAESAQERRVKAENRVPAGWRLACLSRVWGEVRVRASYW